MSERAELKREVFMQIARELARLGTCDRAQVGAVIVKHGRCVSWGYNGAPPGMPHCDAVLHGHQREALKILHEVYPEAAWPRGDGDEDDSHYLRFMQVVEERLKEYGCMNATHAEANALAFAARQGISVAGATLYVTLAPCIDCARLLIAAGIRAVDYDEEYRDAAGIELLRSSNG